MIATGIDLPPFPLSSPFLHHLSLRLSKIFSVGLHPDVVLIPLFHPPRISRCLGFSYQQVFFSFLFFPPACRGLTLPPGFPNIFLSDPFFIISNNIFRRLRVGEDSNLCPPITGGALEPPGLRGAMYGFGFFLPI